MTTEATFTVEAVAATDAGRLREHNEDSYLAQSPVFLVADGMGGHTRGDAASKIAVRHFAELVGREWVHAEDIHEAVSHAAQEINALASPEGAPGTTVAGVALTHMSGRPYWLAFNVGDSRVYLLRDGVLEQISVDHSRRQELLEAGDEEAAHRTPRNIITRALGAGRPGVPDLDQWLRPAHEDDRILICSDGLSGELSDPFIATTLQVVKEPELAVVELISAALQAGGRDIVTAVLVDAVSVGGAHELEDGEDTVDSEDTEAHPIGVVDPPVVGRRFIEDVPMSEPRSDVETCSDVESVPMIVSVPK